MMSPILVCCVYDDRDQETVGPTLISDAGLNSRFPAGELAFTEVGLAFRYDRLTADTAVICRLN